MTEQWESRCPDARAPRSAGRRRVTSQVLLPAVLHCATSFPDHHLSKSGLHEACETQNAPPGTRRRWGVHIAPGSVYSSSHSTEYASLHSVLHRTFLTAVDRRILSSSRRRLPSQTLECRYDLAHPTRCSSRGDPISVRDGSHARTRLPRGRHSACPGSRLSGIGRMVARLRVERL